MFQSFRNQKRWLMLIAMILIIPAFVFIGINGYSRLNPDANAIAKVDGKGIQPEEFDYQKREYIERMRQQEGGAVLDLLIAFLISVVASVVAYYICKWLDGED